MPDNIHFSKQDWFKLCVYKSEKENHKTEIMPSMCYNYSKQLFCLDTK